jgi:GMP synthase (glutamine-hydrolysing)
LHADKIVIIDFGSQYTKLIARKVRECGVFSEVISCTSDLSHLRKDKSLKGIILSGGPQSVYMKNSNQLAELILELDVPILGICYGLQLLSHHFKGKVAGGTTKEFGKTKVHRTAKSVIFEGINKEITVWMSHWDHIKQLPKEFKPTSYSQNGQISSFESPKNRIYGVQFHPEVNHTEN